MVLGSENVTCGAAGLPLAPQGPFTLIVRARRLGGPFRSSKHVKCSERWGCFRVLDERRNVAAGKYELAAYHGGVHTSAHDFEVDQRVSVLYFGNLFNQFASIPEELSGKRIRCAEIAPGPYTRYKVVHAFRPDIRCATFLAIDPLLEKWKRGAGSPFHDAVDIDGAKLTTVSTALEDAPAAAIKDVADLLIVFNALPHVKDAFVFLRRVFEMLPLGGLLVLNDNVYWDNVYEAPHPIKVRWPLWAKFVGAFDVLHATIVDRECFFAQDARRPLAGLYGESGTILAIMRKTTETFPLFEGAD